MPVVIDGFVSHMWGSVNDLAPYLEPGWREVMQRNSHSMLRAAPLYSNPRARSATRDWSGEMVRGDRYEPFAEQLLEATDPERVVLGFDAGLYGVAFANFFTSLAVARAVNDWSLEQWIAQDPRLHLLALIPTGYPEGAAAEIRRTGRNERVVGLQLGPNMLGVPYGMPVYDPIYEAAVELDLPIVLHAKADGAATMSVPPTAGGLVATYGEYDVMAYHSVVAHVVSMIAQGVFDLYPALRVLLVGTGVAWLPAQLWRLDWASKYTPKDAPWLKRLPSEYFARHVRVATNGMERVPQPERLAKVLQTLPWIDSGLVYASGYPDARSEAGVTALDQLPEAWQDKLVRENALDLFRWPGRTRRDPEDVPLVRATMPAPTVD